MAERRKGRGGGFVFAAAAAALLQGEPVSAQGLRPHPIDLGRPYREADYRPIVESIGQAPVVALGESIHLTREMPLVRLGLLRALNRSRGVDALALEGSLLNAWTRRRMRIGARRRSRSGLGRSRAKRCSASGRSTRWNR